MGLGTRASRVRGTPRVREPRLPLRAKRLAGPLHGPGKASIIVMRRAETGEFRPRTRRSRSSSRRHRRRRARPPSRGAPCSRSCDRQTAQATPAMPIRPTSVEPPAVVRLLGRGSQAMASRTTMFMTLISGLRAGPAVSLSGSPTVSPVTAALCFSEPLPVRLGAGLVLDHLLGVVPGAAGVGHEDGEQLADDDHAGEEAAQGLRARGRCRPGSA